MHPPDSEHDRFARVLFYAVVLAVGYLTFRIVSPFLASLAWAAVFAMLLSPLARRFERRMSVPAAATITTLVTAGLIVVPAAIVLTVLVREVTHMIRDFQQSGMAIPTPARLQELWLDLRARVPFPLPEDLSAALSERIQWLAGYVAGTAGSALQNLVGSVFQLFVMLFGVFYFLRDRARVVAVIRHLLPFGNDRRVRIMDDTHSLVVATVGSTFVVALVQGTLTGIALSFLGFRAPVFWGVMTSVFSVIPAVGSGIVWLPAAIWLIASGAVVKGLVLIGFGALVIGMADNVLRPLLLSGRTSMHGLIVFISLMGGVAAFGFIGLVMGPVVAAIMGILLESVLPGPDPAAGTEPPAAARPGDEANAAGVNADDGPARPSMPRTPPADAAG
jgi:predicted PurR-regulated permease PerM